MRRVVVLALLIAGLSIVSRLGEPGGGSQWLLTFGFLILAAYTTGEVATALRLPKIVGYIAAGFIFGPRGADIVTLVSAHRLAPVSELAIALIAFLAGAELRWNEVKARKAIISRLMVTELGVTFVLLALLTAAFGERLPFIRTSNIGEVIAFSIIFASVAIVHSPAVTMGILTETKAGGPIARTTLGVVLVSDIIVVIVFSGALAAARWLAPAQGLDAYGLSVGRVIWELSGAVLIGAILGAIVAVYLRFLQRELFLFALFMAFFGTILAQLLHVEVMLMLLTAGFVAENTSRWEDGEAFRRAMERAAAPVFVVFFALAGAELAPETIVKAWYFVIPVVIVRLIGIRTGNWLGGRWSKAPREGRYVWMGLVSQAGVAIGLATAVAQAYPGRGAELKTIFLAVIAINEILGPILFRIALLKSGEFVEAKPPR